MFVNYNNLINQVQGTRVPRPVSGTLSGHAAGEPFDKHVYDIIKAEFPDETFRQYEYLNALFSKSEAQVSSQKRRDLFESPTVLFLFARGAAAMEKWSSDNPFEEKQNDTADIVVTRDKYFEIIDVKTQNLAKSAQPPNIISAYKMAQVCATAIDNSEFDVFTINYFGIHWRLIGDHLVCESAASANLFRVDPGELYINWAAAMQIQFHVSKVNQDFDDGLAIWAREYLKHWVTEVHNRSKTMVEKFAKPFEKYLD
jgi:hypothetical protein